MFGFSIFLGNELTHETQVYIRQMKEAGFTGIFTSLHIPEEDAALYVQRLTVLGQFAKAEQLALMVDISGNALEKIGLSLAEPKAILQLGVTGLRMDDAIANESIAVLSHQLTVALNASTITEKDLAELTAYGANFAQLEAWHNYYPRPETGLESHWFQTKNRWLKALGFKIQAFVCGNAQLRGPLFQGLPTLEVHRARHPLASALDLLQQHAVDCVYIGDGGLKAQTRQQFYFWQKKQTLLLQVEDVGSRYFSHILGAHVNRQDAARDVIRSAQARMRETKKVTPEWLHARQRGSVTLDNENYGRYMGEIQLTKVDLPPDSRVNVVGKVIATDCDLLSCITAGTSFLLIEKGK